jgi:hypothetical protein
MSILVCVSYSCCLIFGLIGVHICGDEYSFISAWLSCAISSSFGFSVGGQFVLMEFWIFGVPFFFGIVWYLFHI